MKLIMTGISAFVLGGLVVFLCLRHPAVESDEGGDKGDTGAVKLKRDADGQTIVILDTDTQKRIGLVITNASATQWQPEVKGFGHVVDPATLASAIADLETARTAAEASNKEYDRMKTLENNVSARNLDAARAAATRDDLASASARAKFVTAWGKRLAENPAETLKALTEGSLTLFRIDLPAGKVSGPVQGARIWSVDDDAVFKNAEFFDAGPGIDPQTQMQSFLFKGSSSGLKPGAAVEGFIALDGDAVKGIEIPADAVLRHEGKAWIYLQTGENEFTRKAIADFSAGGGWFSRDLTETNRIVTGGAQSILSTELSSGQFNAGGRD